MAKSIWISTAAAAGLLALAAAAPSVAAGPPSGPDRTSNEAATDHHGMDDQDPVPGMAKMHELMIEDNPGMERMHELMIADNPGMERMHELMMGADTNMDPDKMMPSSSTPEGEGEL